MIDFLGRIKQILTKIGTIANTGGTATIGAVLGDTFNRDIATRLKSLLIAVTQPAAYTASVVIPGGGGASQALGTITIAGIPTGSTPAHLFIHFLFRQATDSSAAPNRLNGAQNLQVKKNAGGFTTFFSFAGGEYSTPLSAVSSGDAKKGTIDVLSALSNVANGDVLTFQWTTAKAVGASLTLSEFEVIADLSVTP